jgi:Tol biopolymer transport system component
MTTTGGRRTPGKDALSCRRLGPGGRRWLRASPTLAALLLVVAVCAADATDLPVRTFDVGALATDPGALSAGSADPVISGDGSEVALDAPPPAGVAAHREVYLVDVIAGTHALISATSAGAPAGGSSTDPSIASGGTIVAFVSTAGNLARGASSQHANVYVHLLSGRVVLASGGLGGAVANGAASQPAISGDGRFVVFTSTASNLVAGDRSRRSEVYIHDLKTGKTALVSASRSGGVANGWASNPSVSETGRFVSFDSAATDLEGSPHSHVAQVYIRDVASRHTGLISITSGGVPQDASQPAPFHQVSSISASGEFVAFDSVANNLVRGDTNRRSDVFVHDVYRRTTTLISVNDNGFEGNSDSFSPTITPDGTKVAFESFATNLAAGGGPAENVFVRDLVLRATSVIDVGPEGQRPSRERVRELLERPALSTNGDQAVFESTAANLTGAAGPQTHVFLRLMNPPSAHFTTPPPATVASGSLTLHVAADDPAAHQFDCQVDGGASYACGSTITLVGLHPGRHRVSIRAGGAGMLYQATPLVATVNVR